MNKQIDDLLFLHLLISQQRLATFLLGGGFYPIKCISFTYTMSVDELSLGIMLTFRVQTSKRRKKSPESLNRISALHNNLYTCVCVVTRQL